MKDALYQDLSPQDLVVVILHEPDVHPDRRNMYAEVQDFSKSRVRVRRMVDRGPRVPQAGRWYWVRPSTMVRMNLNNAQSRLLIRARLSGDPIPFQQWEDSFADK